MTRIVFDDTFLRTWMTTPLSAVLPPVQARPDQKGYPEFDPSQPRDDTGRWSQGGPSQVAEALQPLQSLDEVLAFVDQDPDVRAARAKLKTGVQTLDKYDPDGDGRVTPERQQLHDRIVASILSKGKVPPGETPRLIMLMGAPGSGKSSVRALIPHLDTYATFDADEIRKALPDYDPTAAGLTQAEIGLIEAQVIDRLFAEPRNVVVDWIGKTADKVRRVLDAAERAGYDTEVHYVEIPTVEAVKRAYRRFKEGKDRRFVDPTYVAAVDAHPRRTFEAVKGGRWADRWAAYDNSGPRPRKLEAGAKAWRQIMGAKVSKGSPPTTVEEQAEARREDAVIAAWERLAAKRTTPKS